MKEIAFNYKYLNNRDYWFQEDGFKKEISALVFLMNYTGMYRIFSKEDVFEFIARIALVIREQPIFEQVFLEQKIFEFHVEDIRHTFDINDLRELIGFQLIDVKTNFCPRKEWMSNRPQFWNNAIQFCLINDMRIIPMEVENENHYSCPEHAYKDFARREISDAEILANEVIKEIGDEPFKRLEKTHPLKFKELELRRNASPINFFFDNLPLETQKMCWSHWWPDGEHFEDSAQRKLIGDLVKLAFFWANGFIEDSYGNKVEDFFGQTIVDERVNIFVEDYEFEYCAYNLIDTYYEHDLGALFPLLHDSTMIAQSEKPWEKLYLQA